MQAKLDAMETGVTVDLGPRPPMPGLVPQMPLKEAFAVTYYAERAVSHIFANSLVTAILCVASSVANI